MRIFRCRRSLLLKKDNHQKADNDCDHDVLNDDVGDDDVMIMLTMMFLMMIMVMMKSM